MQSGSHKCVSNLAMSEQYNQAGSYQREFQANFPASPSHPAQPVLTAEHPDVGMFFPILTGTLHVVTKSMSSMKHISL